MVDFARSGRVSVVTSRRSSRLRKGDATPHASARGNSNTSFDGDLVARGACSDLLEHCARQHVVVSSQSLLNELHEVLERKFSQRAIDVRAALPPFPDTFTLVTQDPLDPPVCRDRDDDVVLATAPSGECAAIITGDQDLLILNPFRGIQVLVPSAFWKWESEHGQRQIDGRDCR